MALSAVAHLFVAFGPAFALPLRESVSAMMLAVPLFAVVYFAVDSILVVAIPVLRGRLRPTLSRYIGNLGPALIGNVLSAGMAALLVFAFRQELTEVMLYSALPIGLIILCVHILASNQYFRRAEQEKERAHSQSLFDHAALGMAVLSHDGTIREANAAFGTLFGGDAVASRRFSDLVVPEDAATWERVLHRGQTDQAAKLSLDVRCRRADGETLWLTLHLGSLSEVTGGAGLILQAEDSTTRVHALRELDHLAHHDSLTGLPNRRRFAMLLKDAVATARAAPANGYAVLYLDFDGFKRINDTLGHAAGDRFLVEMGRRIRANVRPMDVVARLGGDEFAVLLPLRMPDEAGEARIIADRIAHALGQPHSEQAQLLHGHASIGIVTSERGYADEAAVLGDADSAMYAAKFNRPLGLVPAR